MKKLSRQPKAEKLIRETRVIPGWHCYRGGPPCGPGCDGRGQHGSHNEAWGYIVKGANRREVLVLTVSSGRYPESLGWKREAADGVALTLHAAYHTDTDQLNEPPCECEIVAGGACYVAFSTALGASEFWDKHGLTMPEKIDDVSEDFWLALEDRFRELRKKARASRVDRDYESCPRCLGKGFCKKAGRR